MARKTQNHTIRRLQSRKSAYRWTVQAAIATPAVAGALAAAITAPHATADSGSASLASAIDQILSDEQAAVTYDEALPIATTGSDAMLPTSLQNLEFENLMTLLSQQSIDAGAFLKQFPEVVAGDAADGRGYFGAFDPDNFYETVNNLDPNATYVVSGQLGAGTEDLNINTYNGGLAGPGLEIGQGLVVNPDGSYTVDIGPTELSGAQNYINDAGENAILVRETMGNWALGPGSLNIDCVADCPAATPGLTSTGLSSAEIGSLLNTLAGETTATNNGSLAGFTALFSNLPDNVFTPIRGSATIPGGLATQATSFGTFDLQPGQAEIVQVPDVTANYSGIELTNSFVQTLGYTLEQTSLNNTQAFAAPGGYTDYVISATNPGVANWLDTAGLNSGDVLVRFQGIPAGEHLPTTGITTEVVPVADVSQYLPTDTPTVTPSEYAADMSARVFGYDYALDTSRDSSWVTLNLDTFDLQQAMGTANYDAVFGIEPATPLWLRLTPALSPDESALAKDFLTDPSASFSAIMNNLPVAENDISLPTQLAWSLLEQDVTQTANTVQSDISSDQLPQALTALETGVQGLGPIFNEALLDPNTSITAGILNARDDLATAVITANGGFPSQLDALTTLEWNILPQLAELTPSTALSDFGSLLSTISTDFTALF